MIVITYLDSNKQLKQAGSFDNAAAADRAVEALIESGAAISGEIYWNEGDVHKNAVWDAEGKKIYKPVGVM